MSRSVTPGVSHGADRESVFANIVETINIREGRSARPEERFVTAKELADAGVVDIKITARKASLTAKPFATANTGGGAIAADPPDLGLSDLTPPPRPVDVRARGIGVKNIMVSWSIPAFSNAYYVEVYRTPTDSQASLVAGFNIGAVYNQADNPSAFYRGRSFGNSFLDTLPENDAGQNWFYWARFVSAALLPGPFNDEAATASRTLDPDQFLADFHGVTPLLVGANGSVGVRGDLVVKGLVTANNVDVRELLTANEIWTKSIVGIEATFDTIIGSRVIVGPRYMQDGNGNRILDPADTPLNGISGQWRLALNTPLSGKNVGADGKARIIQYYKPMFSGGVESSVVPAANEAFYLDNEGNVFVGGNLTVRSQGAPGAAISGCMLMVGANGAGVNNAPYYRDVTSGLLVEYPAYNRFALWLGRKHDFVNDGAKETNGIFWVREGVDSAGKPQAGFNADLFLGGAPFSQPSMIGFTENYGANVTRTSNSVRATTLVQDAISSDSFEVKTYLNGSAVEQFPPMAVMVNAQIASHESGTTDNGDSKFALITAEVVSITNTTVAVALIQQLYVDDWTMEAAPLSMMGIVQLPAGNYKIRLRIKRFDDRNLSILKGWRAIVFNSVSSGDFNLIENGSMVGKDWPLPKPLAQQGYYESPEAGANPPGSGGGSPPPGNGGGEGPQNPL